MNSMNSSKQERGRGGRWGEIEIEISLWRLKKQNPNL